MGSPVSPTDQTATSHRSLRRSLDSLENRPQTSSCLSYLPDAHCTPWPAFPCAPYAQTLAWVQPKSKNAGQSQKRDRARKSKKQKHGRADPEDHVVESAKENKNAEIEEHAPAEDAQAMAPP